MDKNARELALELLGNSIKSVVPVSDSSTGNILGAVLELPWIQEEDASCAIVVLDEEDVLHMHNKTTEIYLFFYGEGMILLDDRVNEPKLKHVSPGMAIIIKPGTLHAAIPLKSSVFSQKKLGFLVVSTPSFDANDFERSLVYPTGWYEHFMEPLRKQAGLK